MAVESEEFPKWEEARAHGIGISRHAFHSMDGGYSPVGRKTTGFPFERLLELEPSAALDPLDNPVSYVPLPMVSEPPLYRSDCADDAAGNGRSAVAYPGRS